TMPVTLTNFFPTIEFQGQRVILEHTRVSSQPHGSALGINSLLLLHQVYNPMRSVCIELTGICPHKAANIASKLDYGHLHSQTYAEERDMILPCVANGLYLAFATAIAKSARYQDSVDLT